MVSHGRTVSALSNQEEISGYPFHFFFSAFLFCELVCRKLLEDATSELNSYTTMFPASWLVVLHFYERLEPMSKKQELGHSLVCIREVENCILMESSRPATRRTRKERQQSER